MDIKQITDFKKNNWQLLTENLTNTFATATALVKKIGTRQ